MPYLVHDTLSSGQPVNGTDPPQFGFGRTTRPTRARGHQVHLFVVHGAFSLPALPRVTKFLDDPAQNSRLTVSLITRVSDWVVLLPVVPDPIPSLGHVAALTPVLPGIVTGQKVLWRQYVLDGSFAHNTEPVGGHLDRGYDPGCAAPALVDWLRNVVSPDFADVVRRRLWALFCDYVQRQRLQNLKK